MVLVNSSVAALQQRCQLRQRRCSRCCSDRSLCHLLDLVGLGLLAGVWVLRASENVQLLDGSTGKLVVRHHATDCFLNNALWMHVQAPDPGS